MTCFVKKLIIPFLCLTVFLYSGKVKAQISSIQNLIDKVENYNNLSYYSKIKLRDMSADTTVALNKELFLKAPNDKLYGYFYSIETDHKSEKFHVIHLYNKEGLNVLSPVDSTFFHEKKPSSEYSQSLIGGLKFLKELYNKKPFRITTLKDTIIDSILNSHFVAKVYDTLENNEHLYSNREYYINKQTGLPSSLIIKGTYKYAGLINKYYAETTYSNYNLDRSDITNANFVILKGFKPRAIQAAPIALLAEGTIAPEWALYDANGQKVSLSQLKGKVVILDFYYIGCSGCMASINPLNAIYEKYKNTKLVIVSLTERDSKTAVLDFEKRYKIKYASYVNAANIVKSYHVTAFPTFYFIDKEGKIENVLIGCNDDFEEKVTSIVNNLLNKK